MGGGLLGWGAAVGAAGAGSGMFGAGSLRAAGFDADTAGSSTTTTGSGIAEERNSRRRGPGAWFDRRRADHVACRWRRRLIGTTIVVMDRSLVRARLVSEENRRTVGLIVPVISRGASWGKRVCR